MGAGAKLQEETFIDFNICHRLASLRMLYSLTLTLFFNVEYFKCKYLENGESSRKSTKHDICRFQYLPSNGIIANSLILTYFFKVSFLKWRELPVTVILLSLSAHRKYLAISQSRVALKLHFTESESVLKFPFFGFHCYHLARVACVLASSCLWTSKPIFLGPVVNLGSAGFSITTATRIVTA